jgi:hypothetical protein
MRLLDLIRENAVQDLEKDLKNPLRYDAIDHMMTSIAAKHKITAKKLHDLWVEKHGDIPDKWSKRAKLSEGGNLASHTAQGEPTVGWKGVPGQHTAGKIDTENRKEMQPAVKQLLVDINNTFARQYGRHIWSPELIEKEVHTFMSGSSKWFMFLRQPNPAFDPQQPESDTNPKEIGVTDAHFHRVKKKLGDIDTQIDRRIEQQIEEFVHNNIGKSVGSATLLGTKKGSDQWLALWQLNEPPITLQVDLEFVDYTTDDRGFEIPTEWAQVSHGSQLEDLEEDIKGVFRQFLYRSLAKISPTSKYIAKVTGAGKNKAMRLFGGDDGKELVADVDNPPSPFHDANFSFAVASVGGGGVRAKYRAVTPEDGVPKEINGVPVMAPLTPAESDYIKDMSQQFEQFFGVLPESGEQAMMAGLVGTVELMKKYFDSNQQQVAVQEFLKINFGKGAQMIEANDPTNDFKIKMTAIDYLLDKLGMQNLRKQALEMAKTYEADFEIAQSKKKSNNSLNEAEEPSVVATKREGMPHLWQADPKKPQMKDLDFLDLLDELKDKLTGKVNFDNITMNVKVDGFGGRFGQDSAGNFYFESSSSKPIFTPTGFSEFNKERTKGMDPKRAEEFMDRGFGYDRIWEITKELADQIDARYPGLLKDTKIKVECLFKPFAKEQEDGRLVFVGIAYDNFPKGTELVLAPYQVLQGSTGQAHPDEDKILSAIKSLGQVDEVKIIDNALQVKKGIDVEAIIDPLKSIEGLRDILTSRKQSDREEKERVRKIIYDIRGDLSAFIADHPNIVGKDILGKDYEGIVINAPGGPVKITSPEQKAVIQKKLDARNKYQDVAKTLPKLPVRTAVVAVGSLAGHRGHEQLINHAVAEAGGNGGDVFVIVSPKTGPDDPFDTPTKLQTLRTLFAGKIPPDHIQEVKPQIKMDPKTREPVLDPAGNTIIVQGDIFKKIEHELIEPTKPTKKDAEGNPILTKPKYNNVLVIVGSDRGPGGDGDLTQRINRLDDRIKSFGGYYAQVNVRLVVTAREAEKGGTGVSFTQAREVLANTNLTYDQKLAKWCELFDEKKLGREYIAGLMKKAADKMGIKLDAQPKQELEKQPEINTPENNDRGGTYNRGSSGSAYTQTRHNTGSTGGVAEVKQKLNYQDYKKREIKMENKIRGNKCVPLNEDVELAMASAIVRILENQLNEFSSYAANKNYDRLPPYKRYDTFISKKKFNNIAFIAVAENPRTKEVKFRVNAPTQQEAIDTLHARIDNEIEIAQKVSNNATLDFNVDFVREILEMSDRTFYAKVIPGPKLVIAGSEMENYPEIMKSEGFKKSTIRTQKTGEGSTKLPGVPLSSKDAIRANLIANGRYVLGNETIDKDDNRVFNLEFDSVVADSGEKMRMRVPAVTVGTNR